MKFFDALTNYREDSRISKTELAKRAGVTISYISDLESGHSKKTPPPIDRLNKIADALMLDEKQREELFYLAFIERNEKEINDFGFESSKVPEGILLKRKGE